MGKEKGKEASTGCEPSDSAPSGDTNYFSWPCFACPSGFFVLVSAISALFFKAFRRFASMGKPAIKIKKNKKGKQSSQGASSAGPCRTTIFGLVAVLGMCGLAGFAHSSGVAVLARCSSMLPSTIALPLPAAYPPSPVRRRSSLVSPPHPCHPRVRPATAATVRCPLRCQRTARPRLHPSTACSTRTPTPTSAPLCAGANSIMRSMTSATAPRTTSSGAARRSAATVKSAAATPRPKTSPFACRRATAATTT